MGKIVERLAKKIKEDLDVEVDPETFISIRPRKWHKRMGAWSWSMKVRNTNVCQVGSIYTATECTRRDVKLFRADQHPGCGPHDIDVVPEEA